MRHIAFFRHEFFSSLYHALLLTAKNELRCQCLQAMAVVYGRHHQELGHFADTKYIVAMLDKVRVTACYDKYETGRMETVISWTTLGRI